MSDGPATRISLLVQLRDARAWAQFVDVYASLVFGFARWHSLQGFAGIGLHPLT
jgi:hypothetical protein